MHTEYESNNSGGSWWLDDNDWQALERAGWKIRWTWLAIDSARHETDGTPAFKLRGKVGDRQFGALASHAYRTGLNLREASDEWERVTGKSSTDPGCPCCGQPHTFTEYNDAGELVASGPETSYEANW